MGIEEVAIVGAGPSGLSTALQLKRYGISALLFEGAHIGGLLWNANLVENYPGFPGGISGPELVGLFSEQIRGLSVDVIGEQVISLTHEGDVFQVETGARSYRSRIAVIASGTSPVTFPGELLSEDVHDRVFYEVYPLLSLEGHRIAIVGAGDAAFDYALNLAERNDVIILNRGERLKCLPLLWERASAAPQITYYQRTQVVCIERAPAGGTLVRCKAPSGSIDIRADYLIGAIGREPRLDLMSPELKVGGPALENEGVLYFVGDVVNGIFRQTAIAVGDGILAAMEIYRYLKERDL